MAPGGPDGLSQAVSRSLSLKPFESVRVLCGHQEESQDRGNDEMRDPPGYRRPTMPRPALGVPTTP
jgi:hypothetical protein